MFGQLDDNVAGKVRFRFTVLVGALILAALIALLLLWPQKARSMVTLIVSQPLVAPAPAGKPTPPQPAQPQPPSRKTVTPTKVFTAPPRVPTTINTTPATPEEQPPVIAYCANGCVPGADPQSSPRLPLVPITKPLPPPPPDPPVKEPTKVPPPQQIRIGGKVVAANLIERVEPLYPVLAKQAGISGVVTFTAIIGKDGSIQNLQLVSGHPLLVAAARQAVSQWRYKPTLLNGEAVEVITTIEVHFTLGR